MKEALCEGGEDMQEISTGPVPSIAVQHKALCKVLCVDMVSDLEGFVVR